MNLSTLTEKTLLRLMKGRINSKTLKKAKRKMLRIRVRNDQDEIISRMKKEGIDFIKIYYIVDGGGVKTLTDPDIGFINDISENVDVLIKMGFKLIVVAMGLKSYRITQAEFQTAIVEKYLRDNKNLFEALTLAQKMEDKIV